MGLLNSTRPRIVLPRQLFLTTSSSRCDDCQGQFALVLRWLQSVGDVAIHERHARQPLAQYRLRERNKLGSNGAVRERMHPNLSRLWRLSPRTEQGNRKLIIRLSRNTCCSEAGPQHCPPPSEATRASHGPDDIKKYAFVVVLQVGQLVGEVGEVVANPGLQVLANMTIDGGQRSAPALT
jgi:hypothetical protein